MIPLYLAFACSGAAALIYEITWTRLLTLFMGHTVAAASTVLAAFMGGLAIGAAIAGRLSGRINRAAALRAYALIELLIGLFAIALPFELKLIQPLLTSTYADGNGGAAFALTRGVCALIAVTLPALGMGATFPLAVRWQGASAIRAGRETGFLYAANTFGAAAGAVLSGFVLLPALGMRKTTFIGVALNVVSAGTGWWLATRPLRREAPAALPRSARRRDRTVASSLPRSPLARPYAAIAALAISGCVSLILQVVWTRILALVLGPTTFAFTAMVATFIAGISIGSLLGGWMSKMRAAPWLLAVSLLVAGLAAAAAASRAPAVPLMLADAVGAPDASFTTVVRLQSGLIAALMLPMTVAFGAAFPLGVALATRDDMSVSRDVGYVYAANTAGAIGGALAGGFLLVPRLGLQNTVRFAAALAVAGFAVVAMTHARRRAVPIASTIVVGIAALTAVWMMPPWDRELLSSGAYKYAPYMQGPYRDALLRAGRLLYYREGAVATVSVRDVTGSRSLAIDGKVDASSGGDMLTQRLLAHLPLLLHESPRTVAIIGLGSGVTLGSALRHPVVRADALEISPEVVAASDFFEGENHAALRDPRTRLIIGDGRSHLALTRAHYDVIISEPSNPWMAGIAALFTREFFAAARERLAPGGVMCQWAHAYDISADDLRSIVGTFAAAFPHASLWLVGEGDVLLIGSLTPLGARLDTMRRAWSRPGVADDLSDVEVRDVESLLTLFAAEDASLKAYANQAEEQHDDWMKLEFTGPRSIYGRTTSDNGAVLRNLAATASKPAAVAAAWNASSTPVRRGAMHLRAEAFATAFEDFSRALEHDPADTDAMDGLLRAAAAVQRLEDVEARLKRMVSRDATNVTAAVALSRLTAARGDFPAAADVLRPLFRQPKPDLKAIDQLASVFADAGDADSLAAVVSDLGRTVPDSETTLYYDATLQFMRNRPAEAIAAAERLRARNGRHARCLNLLGAAYATVGRTADARRAFEASIQADPRDPTAYINLGAFELQNGRALEAEDYFAEALTIDPSSASAQDGLARATSALRR